MHEFQAKKKFRRFLYSKTAVFILLLLAVISGKAAWGVFKKERESAENAAQAQRELKKLEDRRDILSSEIARLSTEEGIEDEIRTKYSVAKPGEQFLVIVDDEAKSEPSGEQEKPETWGEKIKKYLSF